jgi:hypothetical protein
MQENMDAVAKLGDEKQRHKLLSFLMGQIMKKSKGLLQPQQVVLYVCMYVCMYVCYVHINQKNCCIHPAPWMPLSAWVVGLQFVMLILILLYVYHNKLQSLSNAHT